MRENTFDYKFEQFQGCIDIHSREKTYSEISPSEDTVGTPDTYSPQTKLLDTNNGRASLVEEPSRSRTITDINKTGDTLVSLCECSSCTPQKRARCQKPKDFVSRWGVYNYKEIFEGQ